MIRNNIYIQIFSCLALSVLLLSSDIISAYSIGCDAVIELIDGSEENSENKTEKEKDKDLEKDLVSQDLIMNNKSRLHVISSSDLSEVLTQFVKKIPSPPPDTNLT